MKDLSREHESRAVNQTMLMLTKISMKDLSREHESRAVNQTMSMLTKISIIQTRLLKDESLAGIQSMTLRQ